VKVLTQTPPPTRFCHVSKFQSSDCLRYNVKRSHGRKYRSELTKPCHFKRKINFFLWGGPPLQTPSPVGGVPVPPPPSSHPSPSTKPSEFVPPSPRVPSRFTPMFGRLVRPAAEEWSRPLLQLPQPTRGWTVDPRC